MAAGLEFGIQQFAVDLELKPPSLRRNEGDFFYIRFKFFQKFFRQPDGARGVVSGRAIGQFDLDHGVSPGYQLSR